MDVLREKISMGRYIYCVVIVILLLCGLTYLLSSCAKEIQEKPNPRTGPLVEVNFSVNLGSYHDELAVESRKLKAGEPATEIIHVTDDILMYATLELEDDHPVNMRYAQAGVGIPDGAYIRIVAYDAPNSMVDSADFIVTGGELLPTGKGIIMVSENGTYDFVAYSLNNNIIPTQSNDFTLPFTSSTYPNLDLLWGISSNVTILGAETVVIEMGHLFSRVRVEATTVAMPGINIDDMSTTYFNPHYEGAMNLNTYSGALTLNGTSNNPGGGKQLATWTGLNTQTAVSDYGIVFTNSSDTVALKIGNLQVGGQSLGEYQLRFTQTLVRGGTYKLKLNFRTLVWAGSNIYWDEARQKLFFLPETTPPSLQGYQGVYFMWGSLIGISPQGDFDPSGTILYTPVQTSSGGWINTQRANMNSWGGFNYDDIPRILPGAILVTPDWLDNHSTRNYLSESNVHDTTNLVGDICKYLTDRGDAPAGNWRMPNAREFGLGSEYTIHVVPYSWSYMTVANSGTTDFSTFPAYVQRTVSGTPRTVFPSGGFRFLNFATTIYQTHDDYGLYLTGSPYELGAINPTIPDSYFIFYFSDVTVSGTSNYPLSYYGQGPVRCIRDDYGAATYLNVEPHVEVEDWEDGGTYGVDPPTTGQGDVWY